MAKDGTDRGGRRVRAGVKPDPLYEKFSAGRPATRLEDPLATSFDFEGSDIPDGAVLYRETWEWLDERGCSQFVSTRLIE